jgi:plastocyanin
MRHPALPLAVLVLALLGVPAAAGDGAVTFQCCAYAPNDLRIQPGESVTWSGVNGADFAQHPLRFDDPSLGQEDSGSSTSRSFPTSGVFTWYCAKHGVNGGTMRGRVLVTLNQLPTASFTASATDVRSGTQVHFDATGSDDPDFANGQTLNYSWDLDGDGADDPGQTSPTPSMVYTNTGDAPRQVTVRLTATDTNSDAVGPESSTKTMVITIEPGSATPPDMRAPVAKFVRAKIERTRVKITFTSDEPGSVSAELRQGHRKSRIIRDFAAAGRHTITLRVPKNLRHRKVTFTLDISDEVGNGATLKRSLRLR